MEPKKEKSLIAAACIVGLSAVVYGMTNENNVIFLIGLLIIIAGYLHIRKRLKDSGKNGL